MAGVPPLYFPVDTATIGPPKVPCAKEQARMAMTGGAVSPALPRSRVVGTAGPLDAYLRGGLMGAHTDAQLAALHKHGHAQTRMEAHTCGHTHVVCTFRCPHVSGYMRAGSALPGASGW